MAAAREKLLANRKKRLEPKPTIKLVQPMSKMSVAEEAPREKIKVPVKNRSALVPGGGRTMGMDID